MRDGLRVGTLLLLRVRTAASAEDGLVGPEDPTARASRGGRTNSLLHLGYVQAGGRRICRACRPLVTLCFSSSDPPPFLSGRRLGPRPSPSEKGRDRARPETAYTYQNGVQPLSASHTKACEGAGKAPVQDTALRGGCGICFFFFFFFCGWRQAARPSPSRRLDRQETPEPTSAVLRWIFSSLQLPRHLLRRHTGAAIRVGRVGG